MSAINETKIWSLLRAYYIQVYEVLNRQFVNVKKYYQILWQCFSEGLLIGWTFIQIMPEILPTWIATGLVVVNSSCGELQVVVNYSNIGRTTSCWRWSQGALPPYTHPPTRPSRCDYRLQRSTHVITGPAPTSAGLVWLHLQHFHWSHVRGLKIHNIRANRPHNTARWLQEGVKWLITGGETPDYRGEMEYCRTWLESVWLDQQRGLIWDYRSQSRLSKQLPDDNK